MDRLTVAQVARSIRFQYNAELDSACWIWTATLNSRGMPIVCRGTETESARRAVYRSYRGALPGKRLMVRCQETLCVNPSHVQALRAVGAS